MTDLRLLVQRRQGFLFLPLVYRLAARLEQMGWDEFSNDPASASFALRSAQRLFGLSALVAHFRVGVEAEACGADLGRDEAGEWRQAASPADPSALTEQALGRPPLAQALDLASRLSEELRGLVETVGVLTGPRTLRGLFSAPPPGLGPFYAVLARAYAERGARALLVVEDPRVASGPGGPAERRASITADGGSLASSRSAEEDARTLAPMLNVARYFRLPTLLLDHAASGPAPGFDLTLGGAAGRGLPVALLEHPPREAAGWRERSAPLLLTEWEVPPCLPAERLLAWVEALR